MPTTGGPARDGGAHRIPGVAAVAWLVAVLALAGAPAVGVALRR